LGECPQLSSQLLWPLQWNVVDGVFEPAQARLRLQLKSSFGAGDLAGSGLWGI
jgi:hypothetical protein